MTSYDVLNDDGIATDTWLLSGSDDAKIIIWDMKTCKKLQVLEMHKNGVTSLQLTSKKRLNDSLYSGGMDRFTINWDMKAIEQRIFEFKMMEAEDLISRKAEVKNRFLEAKFGKKRKKGKGKGKGKKKK